MCIYGQASGVPGPPPPQWYGLAGWGGGGKIWGGLGAGVCGEWSGRLSGVLLWTAMGHWVTERAGIFTQALRKP